MLEVLLRCERRSTSVFYRFKKKNNNNCKLYIYIRSHSRTSFGNCTSVTKKEKEKKNIGRIKK
jgi:hypothetical protein